MHKHHPITDRLRTVPRAMLCNEYLISVFRGKHLAGIKFHSEWRNMRTQLLGRRDKLTTVPPGMVFRIRIVSLMTVRKTEVHPCFRSKVELTRGKIIAEPITAIICEPEFRGLGVPCKSYGIPHSSRINLAFQSLHIQACNGGKDFIFRLTNIAWGTYRYIEPSIRSECNIFPTVMRFVRVSIIQKLGLSRI